ncbi:MAG: hypothetical protein CK540_06850 [Thermoleophilia bacterium]|nr:MAG: hypothetical protein CK540_06850 [Thermoleophilia bacterium]
MIGPVGSGKTATLDEIEAILEQRVRLRDSDVQLAEHLALLDAYDAEGAEARADAVIDVDEQSPAQVARDVLGVAGW